MLKIMRTNIVIRSFFTKAMYESQGTAPVSVPQQWPQKLPEILKIWLLGEAFEPKLSKFSKYYFPLPQSTYFLIAPASLVKLNQPLLKTNHGQKSIS